MTPLAITPLALHRRYKDRHSHELRWKRELALLRPQRWRMRGDDAASSDESFEVLKNGTSMGTRSR